MTIGKQITQERVRQELTTAELAKKSGISHYMLKLVEGQYQNPSVKLLEKIAKGLNCTLIVEFKSNNTEIKNLKTE